MGRRAAHQYSHKHGLGTRGIGCPKVLQDFWCMGSWVAKHVAGRMEDYVIWEETGQQSGAGGATGGEDRKWAQQAQRAQEWAQPGRPIRLIQEASSPDKSHGQGDSLIGKVHNP